MGNYTVVLSKRAERQLDKLEEDIALNLLKAIDTLKENPRPIGCRKLVGRPAYRIRVGNFRIIYDIYDDILLVDVIEPGHRKDIYG